MELAGWALVPGFVTAVAAILWSLRRDAEVGFMVTLTATLLLAPLLWDHYLSSLVLPAAFLAQRGRPWALALPLLSWLPAELLPFVVLAGRRAAVPGPGCRPGRPRRTAPRRRRHRPNRLPSTPDTV